MNPDTSCQDVVRCDICETAVADIHCDICLVYLCKACVGQHFLGNFSKPHKIVALEDRKSTLIFPGCTNHSNRFCQSFCSDCEVPLCLKCIIADDLHRKHKKSLITDTVRSKRQVIQREFEELAEVILPLYQNIASYAKIRESQLEKEYGYISMAIAKHGEIWHIEIDKLVNELIAEVEKMKSTHKEAWIKHTNEINERVKNFQDALRRCQNVTDSNDVSLILEYKSFHEGLKSFPPKLDAFFPVFTPEIPEINKLRGLFGNLSKLSFKSEEHGYSLKTTRKSLEAETYPPIKQKNVLREAESYFPDKHTSDKVGYFPLIRLDKPVVINTVNTKAHTLLYNVTCLSDDEVWTSGKDSTLSLFRISEGSEFRSITTKSGNLPQDIAVTNNEFLVYTDPDDRTVNTFKNEMIEEVIKLQNWRPLNICSTSSDELLITMDNDDYKQSRVVRYSGSTEKQTIQYDDMGKPLYSYGRYTKYISENKNLDICVADNKTNTVVVVNHAGKLRFVYVGHTPTPKNKQFNPRGITTDSHSHILIADFNNECVHMIDRDGQFLCYIDSGLSDPWGLSMDTNDNMFVAELGSRSVKKIRYQH